MTKLATKSPKLKKIKPVKTSMMFKKRAKVMNFDKELCVDDNADVDYHLYDQGHLEKTENITEIAEIVEDVEHNEATIKIKKVKIKEEKKKYYVDNDRFQMLIQNFYDTDVFSDELAVILYNIANRVAFMPNFINYSYKDVMIGEGLLKEIQTIKQKKFDIRRGKAFNYFTTIVWNAFVGKIKDEQKEHLLLREHQSREYDILTSGIKNTSNDNHDSCD